MKEHSRMLSLWKRLLPAILLFAASKVKAETDLKVMRDGGNSAVGQLNPFNGAEEIVLAENGKAISVVISDKDYECVKIAANLFCDDVKRVADAKPELFKSELPKQADAILLAGTLGHSDAIQKLIDAGKIDVSQIKGGWETTGWFMVDKPFDGIKKALVIVGSDRRGTAYGLMELSEKMGVSPWYWWADVPVKTAKKVEAALGRKTVDAPKVRYRGIFINDEDWALHEWAKQNFEKDTTKRIGPGTNEKIFEYMLRSRMNLFWPAMHEISVEFCAIPENVTLADRYGIVTGASHCEPMLRNNCHWPKSNGAWNYSTNQAKIDAYWQESVDMRAKMENVWTLGIRGIHDSAMQGANNMDEKKALVEKAMTNQRAMLNKGITKEFGRIPQTFIPYKEVLPVYDAGLNVPEDVTLMWVDDNYGYIRRLSSPEEQKRSGGSGVYYHISYYGGVHSYCELNTTPLALMQHEMLKAYDNNARDQWVLNVGDSKPMEIGMDYWSKLAWDPELHRGSNDQMDYLNAFCVEYFGNAIAPKAAKVMDDYFRLGMIRKPETMNRGWATALRDEQAAELKNAYQKLLDDCKAVEAMMPDQETKDAWFELVGFSTNLFGNAGLIFMTDRDAVKANQKLTLNSPEVAPYVAAIDAGRNRLNKEIKNGKWDHFVPDTLRSRTGQNDWWTHMQWPWNEPDRKRGLNTHNKDGWQDGLKFLTAASAKLKPGKNQTEWKIFNGLGCSGSAAALLPLTREACFEPGDEAAPSMTFEFTAGKTESNILVNFLPFHALYPTLKARAEILVNGKSVQVVNITCSESKYDGSSDPRGTLVDDNYVRFVIPVKDLKQDEVNTVTIRAVDPGVAVDTIAVPAK